MAASLICSLLVLAAPAARALGETVVLHGRVVPRVAAEEQDTAETAGLPQQFGRGSTRELLTRELRSRKDGSKARARKSRGSRTPKKPKKRISHKPSKTRTRRSRGEKGSAKKVGSTKGGSKKKGGKGSSEGSKPRKGDAELETESLCAKYVVEKEVVRTKNAQAHVAAIEEVFSKACLNGADVDMSIFQEVFMSADAFAFSQTISKAIVTCKSDDEDAYECATVTASAEAYARATAQAHAEAVATAVNACGCMTESVSESISDESIYIQLIADAASTASATACIEGKGRVRASTYDKCSSKVYGRVFAKAVAQAIVKGKCMNAANTSRVLTEASARFDTSSTCGLPAAAIALKDP